MIFHAILNPFHFVVGIFTKIKFYFLFVCWHIIRQFFLFARGIHTKVQSYAEFPLDWKSIQTNEMVRGTGGWWVGRVITIRKVMSLTLVFQFQQLFSWTKSGNTIWRVYCILMPERLSILIWHKSSIWYKIGFKSLINLGYSYIGFLNERILFLSSIFMCVKN